MKFKKIIIAVFLPLTLLGSLDSIYGAEETTLDQSNALIKAIQGGNLRQTLSLLKSKKIDINQADDQGRTPLMFAVQQKSWIAPAMISKLLQSGAKPDTQDKEGKTALAYAILAEKPQAVRQLLSKGADTALPESVAISKNIKKIFAQHAAHKEKEKATLIDPISRENIFSLDPSKRITIGKNTYSKKNIFSYIQEQIASKTLDEIEDPVSKIPLGKQTIIDLATHFNIPITELEDGQDLKSVKTLEEYINEQYGFDEDDSDSEDEAPIERFIPVFEETRKKVFEGARPAGKTPTEKQGILERLSRQELLRSFAQMIKSDTLRVLQYRLQKKNEELLNENLSDEDYQHTRAEIRILKQTIRDRLKKFESSKPPQQIEQQEPFIFFG